MKFMKSALIFLFAAVFLFSFIGTAAAASDKDEKQQTKQKKPKYDPLDRSLKNHQFMRPYFFPLALTTTNVGVSLGYFYSTLVYDQKIDYVLFQEDQFRYAGLDETIDAEFRFHELFSAEFLILGRAVTGADNHSALIRGGEGAYTGTFVPKINFFRSESSGTAISIASPLSYDQGAESSPILLLNRMLDNANNLLEEARQGNIPDQKEIDKLAKIKLEDAITTTSQVYVKPSLLIAQTLVPALGVQGSVAYKIGLQETMDVPGAKVETGDAPTALQAGGQITFDSHAVEKSVGIGLKAEVDYSRETNDGTKMTQTTNGQTEVLSKHEKETITQMYYGGGVLFTGRKNLDLGMTFFWVMTDSKAGNSFKGQDALLFLNMRYYF